MLKESFLKTNDNDIVLVSLLLLYRFFYIVQNGSATGDNLSWKSMTIHYNKSLATSPIYFTVFALFGVDQLTIIAIEALPIPVTNENSRFSSS